MGEWRDKLNNSDQAVEAARKEAESRVAAAEQATRFANEARMRAEKRGADAESNARPGVQNENLPGSDEKFTEARRVFGV